MAEQAQSSRETSESGNNENMQEMMIKFMQKLEENLDKNTIQIQNMEENSNVKFQEMRKQFDNKFQEMHGESQEMRKQFDNKFQEMHEQFQDIKVEFQKARGELQEESETVSEKPSEIDVPSNHKVSNAKRRRIRKLRILKSLGIKVSKFRKRLEKVIRLDRVKKFRNCHLTKYKRSSLTKHKYEKPQSEVTNNRNFRYPVSWVDPCQAETTRFQAKYKVQSKKENLFSKPCRCDVSRGLGEQLYTKCYKGRSNGTSEKLKTCTNCQMLQSSFQTRTKVIEKSIVTKQSLKVRINLHDKCTDSVKLKVEGEIPRERLTKESIQPEHKLRTKSSHKIRTNLLEVDYGRTTNRKIPFKMKRKVIRTSESKISFKMKRKDEIVRFRKINVKMKEMSEQVNFGKLKWKFKDGINNPKTIC
jgi:hypothetical protein